MKKVISIALSATIMAGCVFASYATKEDKLTALQQDGYIKGRIEGFMPEAYTTGAEALTMLLRVNGEEDKADDITSIGELQTIFGEFVRTEENGIILKYEGGEILVNTDLAAIRGDKTLDKLEAGDSVSVVASAAATRSIPPIVTGYVVVISEKASASYLTVEAVTSDDGIKITDKDESVIVTAEDKTPVTPFRTKNIMNIADISKGDRIVVISEVSTMSLPPITNAEEIIVIEDNSETEKAKSIKLNGHWAENIIAYAAKMGYIAEDSAIISAPDSEISGNDFLALIFDNLKSDSKTLDAALKYAVDNDIFTEKDVEKIKSSDKLSRKDMAFICYSVIHLN